MQKKLFVLDTNVLMHDPAALYNFKEHDVFLPMEVLEELDGAKKGMSEIARNVRQVSRFLDEIMANHRYSEIERGLPLPSAQTLMKDNGNGHYKQATGRLYVQTRPADVELPGLLPGNKPDNFILITAIWLKTQHPNTQIIVVSKDINMRIKAAVLGIHAEDYSSDQVLDDLDLLFTGYTQLSSDFWNTHSEGMESWQEQDRTFYRIRGDIVTDWYPGQFLYFPDEEPGMELVVRQIAGDTATLELIRDYREGKQSIWGVHARNREQNFAMEMLQDPNIDLVTILGAAGTGKTLLALAAGLSQTMDEQRYREVIMTRNTIPLGDDIGFLPGTEEEKMTPWMGALMDNLEVLTQSSEHGEWERAATEDLLSKRIKVRSLNFMRGRTFLNRYIILDEAQNLTPKQMKTLITRAGPGSKVVCLGNLSQIDTPYLTETTSGLTNVVDRFRNWPHAGHVTLARGERSRLAAYASDTL